MRGSLEYKNKRNKKLVRCWKAYLIAFSMVLSISTSAVTQQSEYTIKAVFLEHFTRFVEWPESCGIADTSTPFVIAVIGESPFGSILDQIYTEQKIRNKKVEILYISTPDEITDYHILFISSSNKEILPEILSRTRNKPILTVSDTNGYAEEGVLINFILAGDKIKFEINEGAVHESGLVMSYRLLNLAKIVNPGRGRK